jgi:hypothetical protein
MEAVTNYTDIDTPKHPEVSSQCLNELSAEERISNHVLMSQSGSPNGHQVACVKHLHNTEISKHSFRGSQHRAHTSLSI